MPQQILPLIPRGATQINDLVSVFRDDTNRTYFYSTHPIYSHKKEDCRMFRMITAQMVETGACRQRDIQRIFGVSKSSVIRSVNKLRSGGVEAFFAKRTGRRGGSVFTPDTLEQAQALLDQGRSRKDTAQELGIKYDTFRRAINDGRLTDSTVSEVALTKSSRDAIDIAAADGMGTGCTRVFERILASLGKMVGAPVCFEKCLDVPFGGVLCALYIDGHVRVYHGKLTELPRRYVSRQRLCLRGITDYWVNDAIGRPFFVIEKQIDPGMLATSAAERRSQSTQRRTTRKRSKPVPFCVGFRQGGVQSRIFQSDVGKASYWLHDVS